MTAQFPKKPLDEPVVLSLVKPTSRGVISVLYNLISNLQCPSIAAIKLKWEQDLNFTFTNKLWDSILSQVHTTSMCARHALIQFKIFHCAHLSKVKLACIYPDINPMCGKCRGDLLYS